MTRRSRSYATIGVMLVLVATLWLTIAHMVGLR